MPKLKPESLAARRETIYRAALSCFAEHGYHQTTMDNIAQSAGLSKGGIYAHFTSKKQLFLDLFDWINAETGLEGVLDVPGSTAYERLTHITTALAKTIASSTFKDMWPLLLDVWAQNLRDDDFQRTLVNQYQAFEIPLIQVIEDGIANGEFKPIDATTLARLIIAAFDGLMVRATIDETTVDWKMVAETFEPLIKGIVTEGADL